MTKPGPSPEYRDLVRGRITVDEYLSNLKREVNARLGIRTPRRTRRGTRAAV